MKEIEEIKKRLQTYKDISTHPVLHDVEILLSSLETRDNEIKALEGLRMSLRDEITELESSLKKEEQAHTMSVYDLNMKIAEVGIALEKEKKRRHELDGAIIGWKIVKETLNGELEKEKERMNLSNSLIIEPNELWIDFSYANLPRERVIELAHLPSGRIAAVTDQESFLFDANGKSPKGSYLIPWEPKK